MTAYKLVIEADSRPDKPGDDSDWHYVTFNHDSTDYEPAGDHIGSVNPTTGEVHYATAEIAAHIVAGTAFLVSQYGRIWYLKGSRSVPDGRWDETTFDGVLYYHGDASDIGGNYEDREASARSFMQEYTDWAEGNVYGFALYRPLVANPALDLGLEEEEKEENGDPEGDDYERWQSSYGFTDVPSMIATIWGVLEDGDTIKTISGGAKWLTKFNDFKTRPATAA
jgi:hypothetical protein